MSKRIVQPKTIIITSLITIVVIFCSLLYAYYRNSLLHLNGAIDKDFFPAFGSFLGNTVGVILSFGSILLIYYTYQSQQEQLKITKGLVNRQIALSIKPDIVMQDFYTYDKPIKKFVSAPPEFDGILPNDLRRIEIKILNVGVEVARYLEYSFEYDVMALINYMNTSFSSPPLNLIYEHNKSFGKVIRIETGVEQHISFLSSIEKNEKDYLMPYKLDKDHFTVSFPRFYILIYYYTLVGRLTDNVTYDLDLPDLPKCSLNISYNDLEGITHKKKFILKIELLGGLELSKPEQARDIGLKISGKELSKF